jgi:hypothetical protein
MNSDNIPLRFMLLDELPCFSFSKSFTSSIHEMCIRITNTFFPCRWIVIVFLTMRSASKKHTL